MTREQNREDVEDDPDATATFPHLNTITLQFKTPDFGPDLEDTALPVYVQPVEPLGVALDRLFSQYACNIIQKIVNPKDVSMGSYCPLKPSAQECITLNDIITTHLGWLFTAVQWWQATVNEWQKPFCYLFPAKGHTTLSSAQHYHITAYYREWKKMLLQLSDEDAGEVRAAMFQHYNTLMWVLAASNNHLWNYSQSEEWKSIPPKQGGPRIYFTPQKVVCLTLHTAEDVEREALCEEEEESSNDED